MGKIFGFRVVQLQVNFGRKCHEKTGPVRERQGCAVFGPTYAVNEDDVRVHLAVGDGLRIDGSEVGFVFASENPH